MKTKKDKEIDKLKMTLYDEINRLSKTLPDEDISKILEIPKWVLVSIRRKYNSKVEYAYLESYIKEKKLLDKNYQYEQEKIKLQLESERFDNNLRVLYNKTGEEYMTLDDLKNHFHISLNALYSHINRLELKRKRGGKSRFTSNEAQEMRERNLEIINKWLSKDKPSLQKLGDEFEVSRERIRQIIKDAKVHRNKEPKFTPEEIEQNKLDRKACKIAGNYMKFWDKVKISNYCWEWQGYTHPKSGYGIINVRFLVRNERYTHRISWILKNGEIPNNLNVLHKCDNPKCINPKHLYLGTQLDNIRDREERYAEIPVWSERKGAKVPRRKVTTKK